MDGAVGNDLTIAVGDAEAMESVGKRIAGLLAGSPACVALEGELGAGKTTFVRGVLRGLGFAGVVRSPTYTLMEEYLLGPQRVIHLDLYRLSDPGELEYLGLRDALSDEPLIFVEWADRGRGELPGFDLIVRIAYQEESRRLSLIPVSSVGERVSAGMVPEKQASEGEAG